MSSLTLTGCLYNWQFFPQVVQPNSEGRHGGEYK